MNKIIEFPIENINHILAHAQSADDAEICGFISAKAGKVCRVHPVQNVSSSPACFYRMDEKQQIDVMRSMRESGEDLFGIYHSHPSTEAVPSATDIKEATYPEAVYFIVSLNTVGVLEMRGFYLKVGEVEELEINVLG